VLTLVELLVELKQLATSTAPNRIERVNALFADPRAPAEFQVGRHYIAQLLVPDADRKLASFDRDDRIAAIATCRALLPRSVAANFLRRVVKDPDSKVRGQARRAIQALALTDVAPPDIRYSVTADSPRGGHNPTGWAFGMFPNDSSPGRKPRPKQPTRPTALAAHGLPKLASRDDVAKLVGVDPEDLKKLMRPGVAAGSGYVEFEIAKAKGGTRRIAAPRTPLRRIQRTLLDAILAKVPVHDACHGFVPGRSTVTNARPHEHAALVLKLDLRDFFPTVHFRRVRGLFRHLGYGDEVAGVLAGLTTYRPTLPNGFVVWPGVLPQGAPTSPALANLSCRRLDQRLVRLAAKCGASYTRYADDLTFSFQVMPTMRIGRFLWWVDGICQQEGFTERADKRRILRRKHQQRVTGLVVNDAANIPRADRRRFRAMLHNCAKHGLASQVAQAKVTDVGELKAYLAGYAAYVRMVDPELGAAYQTQVAALIGGG
jgi:RNA-directed DNA polymerase